MNKLLITIQGRTLILYYQIKQGLARNGSGRASYIEVLPSSELNRFNLKGLTAEMFCVNIADMVNIRGMYSGQVENERQVPVARWEMNYDEYLQMKLASTANLSHQQIVSLLSSMPAYVQETDNQYIEFEELVVPHNKIDAAIFSGYRLTVMTEETEDSVTSSAYYYLDTHSQTGWQEALPPAADFGPIQIAVKNRLKAISDAGVQLSMIRDETDYEYVQENPE